jgi:hypothetical protein
VFGRAVAQLDEATRAIFTGAPLQVFHAAIAVILRGKKNDRAWSAAREVFLLAKRK